LVRKRDTVRRDTVPKWLDGLALILVVVGALNWALVGLFKFDLVAKIVGKEFGEVNAVSRIIYIIVGLAGLYSLYRGLSALQDEDRRQIPA
jgi:uncharacterized membrane protein YuzA (DUF378 family)